MTQTYSPAAPPTSRVYYLLTLVWAVMTLSALAFVAVFCLNAPCIDEWEFIPALLGKEPVTSWLWSQHNEHRLPLSRAVYYALFQLTHDFRTGMYLQVGMLSGLALGLMRFAARLRGRPDWVDAFFPITLLHLGHSENFTLGYQICFALFCCFVSCLVVVVLQTQRETAFGSGLVAGVLLLLIALTGGFGLPIVPPVAAWLAYLGVILWREGSKLQAFTVIALAVLPLVYMALYFASYERPSHHPPLSRDPLAVGIVGGEVLAMAFGYGVVGVWWLVAIAELAIGVATVGLLIGQARNPANRPASAGLIAVAAGVCGLAIAIGIGRASIDPDVESGSSHYTRMGLWSRYSLLVWPLLGATFLVWVKAGRKWLPIVFCVAAALAFTPNMLTGMFQGAINRTHYMQIENDARAGLSPEEIVYRSFPSSRNAGQEERAIQYIPLLRAAGIGIFGAGNR